MINAPGTGIQGQTHLSVAVGGDELQELASFQAQTIRSRHIDQTLAGLSIEARQDIRGGRRVMVDLAGLELVQQFRRKTFRKTGLSPVDAIIPVARTGSRRGILFKHGARDVLLQNAFISTIPLSDGAEEWIIADSGVHTRFSTWATSRPAAPIRH